MGGGGVRGSVKYTYRGHPSPVEDENKAKKALGTLSKLNLCSSHVRSMTCIHKKRKKQAEKS